MVWLVGAGPGDPDLITVRGLRVLRAAEAVVHDRLVHDRLLGEASRLAALHDVGKAPGRPSWKQEQIHDLLIELARAGRRVVRLKGGDPFVYGRGGEECMALAEAGIRFEVVPGVTSALAVPAFAGIPITHREIGRSFTVLTGHTATGQTDWASAAQADTVVVLMGLHRLATNVRRLVEVGKPWDTPAAVIACGGTRAQKTVRGTLRDIARLARGVAPPAVLVVGAVVRLSGSLSWFHPESAPDPFHHEHRSPRTSASTRVEIAS